MASGDRAFAERDIFGSDSELSDAPEADEEEIERPRKSPLADVEESSGDSGDEYVQERQVPKKKRVKRREDDQEDMGRRPTRKRKRKTQPTEQDLSELAAIEYETDCDCECERSGWCSDETTDGGRRSSVIAFAMRMRFPNARMPSSVLRRLTSSSRSTSPVISCSARE
ncbi:hypothetical protein EWM64_g8971 [Hericium alpestre]|uniref:Uncharacterized protein n=1 Tax=Hericium alpestre TaxID=135208 RepID=A0A4Y9ZLA5_9AGAM|nr:hypothetical protein EWM64_g8971 [Hericium alpestre]